jgi:integrase
MATVVKTAAGTWKAVVRKHGWPPAYKTFRTKRDAQDWSRRTEDEMVRGVFIDRSDAEQLTLKEALARYVREVSPTKRRWTSKSEVHRARTLTESLGSYSLAAITPDLIAKHRDKRLALGLKSDTVRLELALLSHLYTIAMREWRLGLLYNPVALVRKPPPGPARTRRLVGDEEQRLVAACSAYSNPMLGWIVRLAIHTGMRAGEIQTLRLDQVDLTRRIVTLNQTKNGSSRTIPLTQAAATVLKEAIDHPLRPRGCDMIFYGDPGRDGIRRPFEFNPAWQQVLKDHGITGLRFHDLRHEAVSRLVEAGLGDQEVAAISGHRSMQMLRRYTHLRAEDLVVKLDRLGVR